MKLCTTLLTILLACILPLSSQAQVFNWAISIGDTTIDRSTDIVIDSQNNSIITGYFAASSSGNNQKSCLAKYSSHGNLIWSVPFTGLYHKGKLTIDSGDNIFLLSTLYDSVLTGTGIYIPTPSHSYVQKYSSSGVLLSTLQPPGAFLKEIDADAAGNLYVTGKLDSSYAMFGNTIINSGANSTHFLAKYSAAGNWEWVFSLSGEIADKHVSVTPNGNIFLAASYINAISIGSYSFPGTWPNDWFIAKFDTAGNLLWAQHYPTPYESAVSAIASDANDNFFVAVDHMDLASPQVATNTAFYKFSSTGSLVWSTTSTGSGHTNTAGLVTDAQGNLYAAGSFSDDQTTTGNITTTIGNHTLHGSGFIEAFVAKFSPLGALEWAIAAGGHGMEYATGLGLGTNGICYLTGFYISPVMFGNTTFGNISLPNSGHQDVYIASLSTSANTITGRSFFDSNSNGQFDAGEIGADQIILEAGPIGNYHITNQAGRYFIYVDTGTYTVSIPVVPLYYTVTPASHTASFGTIGLIDSANHFALQPIPNQQDLRITATALTPPRPGFSYPVNITYKNVGTMPITSTVEAQLDAQLTYIGSAPIQTSQAGNTLTWTFNNLQPQQSQVIQVMLSVLASQTLGDTISNSFSIGPLAGDLTPANNSSSITGIVVGSFDPNDKQVSHAILTPTEVASGKPLDYTIRFQNTGTDTAFTVVILDTLDTQLNIPTFEVLQASHPHTWSIRGNGIIEFRFDNILLPDSNTNESLSHGFIKYRIKPRTNLLLGDVIRNTAGIYFDFNAPVITNTVTTEVALVSGVLAASQEQLHIWPNPNKGEFMVQLSGVQERVVQAVLRNMLGQVVWQQSLPVEQGRLQHRVQTCGLSTGIYYLQVSTGKGNIVHKIVVE